VFRILPGLFLIIGLSGQVMDDRLSFEAASIKASANHAMLTRMVGGPVPGISDPIRFRATNAELSALVCRVQSTSDLCAP
jgi:hypothetical protein